MKSLDKTYKKYVDLMTEALSHEDYDAYHYVSKMLEETISDALEKRRLAKEGDTDNFFVLNHIIESKLPYLFTHDKKSLGKILRTIKEDKNLSTEYNFYNSVMNADSSVLEGIGSDALLESYVSLVRESTNPRGVMESNKKLRGVLKECKIVNDSEIDDGKKKVYESMHAIFSLPQTFKNTEKLYTSFGVVKEAIEKNARDKNGSKDAYDMIREYEEKVKANLNEDERELVKDITSWSTPIREKRKESCFNTFKNECLKIIDKMIAENGNSDELGSLKQQIDEMAYSNESVVKDLAKLLEIRDILLDS